MNDDESKETASTSELLDLIQADVIVGSSSSGLDKQTRHSNFRGNSYNSNNKNVDFNDGRRMSSGMKASFNRVHLTPHSYAKNRSGISSSDDNSDIFFSCDERDRDEDDSSTVADLLDSYSLTSGIGAIDSNNSKTKTRQRMPLNGGYGGMFAPGTGSRTYSTSHFHYNEADDIDGNRSQPDDGVSGLTLDQSTKTGYTLTSKIFSIVKGSSKTKAHNPYSSSSVGNASTAQTISSSASAAVTAADISFFAKISLFYLNMPFRLRYFIQLFSIMGVLMIASLNYFIAMDHVPMDANINKLSPLEKRKFIGGGASTNKIPRIRVRNPLKFLHGDYNNNKNNYLMERASEKLGQSSRYKGKVGDQSPFTLGWKSMPRQIFNDFETGLSGDRKTIPHANAAKNINKRRLPPKGTVAYVLPLVTCAPPRNNAQQLFTYSPNQPTDDDSFRDFAVMLRAMIHAQSYQNPSSESRYDYKMHAIIHPQAKRCSGTDRSVLLQNLGYHVTVQSSPVDATQLKGFDDVAKVALKETLEKVNDDRDVLADLARLHVYEMEDYDAVVMVDFDTLVVGSIDEALDLIVEDKYDGSSGGSSSSIDAVFSWEHVPLMKHPEARASVINLSFFVLRPSKDMYKLLLETIKKAPFSVARGWGSTGRGPFPGYMTTQGFLTYFYDEVRNGAKVELSRCSFGNTAEPSLSLLITNGGNVKCDSDPDASNQCNDCSKSTLDEVRVADFSYCLAPWRCGGDTTSADNLVSGLCRQLDKKWFSGRLQMEDLHPQLQKTIGKLCIDGQYQPMVVAEH